MSAWISVTDRLPNYNDAAGPDMCVLCWMTDMPEPYNAPGPRPATISYFNVEDWVKTGKCTHWMPISSPPAHPSESQP